MLTEYVRTVLIIEGFSESCSQDLPIFTNGLPTLFCRTKKDQSSGFERIVQLTLYGMSAPPECWVTDEKTTVIAWFFKPFVLPALFNISAKDLKIAPVEFSHLSPHKFNSIKTQIAYADSTTQKKEVIENLILEYLNQHSRTCKIIQSATEQIMNNPGGHIMAGVIEDQNITERTFQRIFKKFVGVTPTQFRRICQFQQSFGQLRSKQFSKVSDVAFDNHFSDQSHFIRSFKEFAQTTPNDYLKKGLTGKGK